MTVVFQKPHNYVDGTVFAVPSKSYFHRYAILLFLCGEDYHRLLPQERMCDDEKATVACLDALQKGEQDLYPQESASTLRFLLPIVSFLGKKCIFHLEGNLAKRNHLPLIEELNLRGAKISLMENEIFVDGKICEGEFFIEGKVSSQFVSGLLLSLSTKGGYVHITSQVVSEPYIDMTIECMRKFGLSVQKREDGYKVLPVKGMHVSSEIAIEGDWSGATFFFCLGALLGKMTVKNLNAESRQGDKEILNVLQKSGAGVSIDGNNIKVTKKELKPISFDAQNTPDIVPVLSAYCAFCLGKSVLKNVERLQDKESNRIVGIQKMLSVAGIESTFDGKDLTVYGGKPHGGKFDGTGDHRIVMACTLLAFICGSSTVGSSEAVTKSYPTFFEDVTRCGGQQ